MTSKHDKSRPPPYRRKEVIGDCTLGNSVELLPYIGVVDHCITDPPYGVDVYAQVIRRGRGASH